MMNRRDRAVRLAKARQQFHKAQVRVAALETRAAKAQRLPLLGEENYHRIFDNLLEGCQIIGFDWRYRYVNAAAARQGQQTKEELLDHTLMERYPGIEKTAMFTVLQRCMQERTVENIENEFHYADGTSAWFELKVQPVQEGIFVLSLDITERKKAEESLKRYAQQIEVLHEIDQGIIQATSLQAVVETALKHIRQLIPCQRASVGVFDYENDEWLVFAVDGVANTVLGQGTRFPIQPDSIENSQQSEVTVIADLRTLQEPLPAYRQFIQHGLVSVLHAHFAADGRPLGSLNLFADTPGYFTAEHQKIAAQITAQFAIAMKQKQLSEDLARHAALLERRVNERTAELQMAKERVEAILNNSADGIVLLHPDLRIQQANPSCTRLFACELDECLGKPLVKFIHREDINTVAQVIQTVVAEQPRKRVELRAIRKDGALFDAEFSIGLIKGEGLVCVIRDITQRKAQERQLRYQASLQDNVSDAVIVTDAALHIQSWNRAAERIYGWRAEEVIGKATPAILRTQFVTADDRERSTRQLYQQEWWQGEVLQYHKDGTVRHLLGSVTLLKDEHGAPTRVVAVNHDITERKQVEEALQASAAEIFDLYNNAPCGYHSVDQDGVIVQINDTELRWLGYDRADVVGKLKFNDLLAPESLRTFEQNFPLFQEQGWIKDLQFTLVRKDGSTMHTLLSATVIYDDDGRFLKSRSTLFDITELKQAQQALAESEARYRLLAENISDMVMRINVANEYIYISPSCRTVLGYEPAELVGQSAFTYVHPDDLSIIEQTLLSELLQTVQWGNLVVRVRHKQGHYVWLESTGQVIRSAETGAVEGFIASARDISDRKRAEADLKASEEKYRRLIENMRGGLAVYDVNDQVTYINDRACELLGYPRDEVIGTRPYDYVDDTTAQEIKAQLAQRRLRSDLSYELTVRRKDGTPVHLLISGSPLFDTNGEYSGSLVVTTDITPQKQAEAALRQALAKEQQLGELKSRFISMASHEFRTPLATILALTETLSAYRHKFSEEQIEQRFDKIKDQVDHLKDIMEDVLLLARMQARRVEFNPINLDLDDLCHNIVDEFQSRIDIKHELNYQCNGEIRIVELDPKLMRQIISNLISNAIKYSPADKPIHVTLAFGDKAFVLKVHDNGIGIPEADLQHLFEPFHRAANVGAIPGTGLGLVITKEAVELHGGTVAVESQLQRGTTFTIHLPALQAQT